MPARADTPSIAEALAVLAAALRAQFPGLGPVKLVVKGAHGQRIKLPFLDVSMPAVQVESCDPVPFVPTSIQQAILDALKGKALRTDALGAAVGDHGRLYKKGSLKELRDMGRVQHHERLGFYRSDFPPPQLAGPAREHVGEAEEEGEPEAQTLAHPGLWVSSIEQLILDALADGDWHTGQQLTQAVNIPRPSVNQLASNLTERRILEAHAQHGYRLREFGIPSSASED